MPDALPLNQRPFFTEEGATDLVLSTFENAPPRLREIIVSLVTHLHGFIREVKPSEEEWYAGLDFLNRTGQMHAAGRNEFVLLSDVLGATMLMLTNANPVPPGATPGSVLGPFHDLRAPNLEWLADIRGGVPGRPVVMSGRILTITGSPIAGAKVQVWQTAENGLYDSQDPDQPEINLRGTFRTNALGEYALIGVEPLGYSAPMDGTGGQLLRAAGRGAERPAHVHVIASAPGYHTVVTAAYVDGDKVLRNDAAFGVCEPLVVTYREAEASDAERFGLPLPFRTMNFDLRLAEVV